MVQNPEHDQIVTTLQVPAEHMRIGLIDANETYLLAGRGTFKTSIGITDFNVRRVFEMPRSTGVGVGLSFNHLYENTLPPFKASLLKQGYVESVHFTVSGPPPSSWPRPYLGVLDKKYTNIMSWYNGTSVQLISLHRKASANGVSAQWGFFDEVKFMNHQELQEEIFPIFRGNEQHFKQCSGYLSKFFATDKEADPMHIKWLLQKRSLVHQKKIEVILALQVELNNLKQLFNSVGINKRALLKPQIHAIEVRLAILRANCVYVGEISADDVREILGDKWYNDKRRNSTRHVWDVAFLNKDPDRPGEAFYPAWDTDKHTYDTHGTYEDVDPTKPLILTGDYQHTVAPLPIAQLAKLQGSDTITLNFVDEVYTLYPEGLRKAVTKFCERFRFHPTKDIFYPYDHTAIGKRTDADEYYKIVVDELSKNGWIVYEVYLGQAPGHYQKYLDTKDWMEETEDTPYPIRVNRRCKKMILSITGAAAKTSGNETKKDKALETEKTLDQSETTHFSDAFDQCLDAVNKQKLIRDIVERSAFGAR